MTKLKILALLTKKDYYNNHFSTLWMKGCKQLLQIWLKLQVVFAKQQKNFNVIGRYRFSSYKHRNRIQYMYYNSM